jgi:hypothetical protein
MKKVAALALAAGLAVVGACGAEPKASQDRITEKAPPNSATSNSATASCGTESGTGCAPKRMRVDRTKPSFSNPTEDKTFAPGYGEFYTAGGGDVEALAVPTDALSGPLPAELETLSSGALDIFDAARSGDWNAAPVMVEKMTAAWETYRAGEVPKMVEPRMTEALAVLAEAVDARDAAQARQAAIDAARWSLDLQLQYRPPAEIDLSRFDLWAAQLVVDAAAGDAAAVNGDFFALDYIRDRIMHTMDGADATRINTVLEELQGVVGDEDLAAATNAAERLRETLTRLDAAPGK